MKKIVPVESIVSKIIFLRGEKVLLDRDLAKLYGVTTKRLNEQVKRNHERFAEDFMFQLTTKEKGEVVANCDHLSSLKYSPALDATELFKSTITTPLLFHRGELLLE